MHLIKNFKMIDQLLELWISSDSDDYIGDIRGTLISEKSQSRKKQSNNGRKLSSLKDFSFSWTLESI